MIEFYKSLAPSIKSTIWITLILIVLIIILRIYMKVSKYGSDKPVKGIILFVEQFIGMMNNFSKEMVGKRWRSLAPYFITLSIFLFTANISGLFGFTPPTVSLSVTLALSLITFIMIHFWGIRSSGIKNYLKGLADPLPMAPLNIISEVLTPFSLALRLFGNILSGAVIMGLVYTLLVGSLAEISPILSIIVPGIVAPAFHAIFDIFFGGIQTYVFVLLTSVFISGKLPEQE